MVVAGDEDEPYETCDDILIICQGYPRCDRDIKDIQSMAEIGGCVWCEKIWFDSEGQRSAREAPGEA